MIDKISTNFFQTEVLSEPSKLLGAPPLSAFPSPFLAAPQPCEVCLYYNQIALYILAFLFVQRWPLTSRTLFLQAGKNALSWRNVLILTAKGKAVSRHAMELLVAIGARGIKMMSYCLSRTVVVMNSASKEKKLRPWRVIVKLFNYKHYFCCSRLKFHPYVTGQLIALECVKIPPCISNCQGGCEK